MESHYIHLNSEQKEFPTIPCSYVEMLEEKKKAQIKLVMCV